MTNPASPDFERFSLDANGFRFDAVACGDAAAPLVLFLHGWPSFAASWRAILPAVAAAGFRAAAVDQRGYSRGARPPEIADYSVAHLIADIEAFAQALAPGAPLHLVGHDWGGLIAWAYAGHRADRLASLTVLSTPHSTAFREALRDDPEQRRMSDYIRVFRQPDHRAERALLADGAAKLRALYAGKCPPDEVAENAARLSEPGALTATLNWYRALDNEWLGAPIATPTLYIWGSADLALGASAAHATGRNVTGPYQFEILEGASHWLPEEAPETISALLIAHLTRFDKHPR